MIIFYFFYFCFNVLFKFHYKFIRVFDFPSLRIHQVHRVARASPAPSPKEKAHFVCRGKLIRLYSICKFSPGILLLSVAHTVRATSPHWGEWRRLVQDKTHSAPGNGCCGSSMNLTGSLLFMGCALQVRFCRWG